jgi:hypothetical protein
MSNTKIKKVFIIEDGKKDVIISLGEGLGKIVIEEAVYKSFSGMEYEEFIKEFQKNSSALLFSVAITLATAKDES